MAKTCNKCGELLFEQPNGKSRTFRCKACRKVKQAKKFNKDLVEYRKYLSDLGCICCREDHPHALEVHHLASEYKRYGRSQGHKYNKEDIEDGLAVVLCASCHNIFHGHFGGKNSPFPTQTKESVQQVVEFARRIVK